ncbi:MAG TPA: hypothetical protein VFG76_02320 [Candidatus Polarisedimenticolia bacterium]|nr:hypothetical protein [Candidatus Polarisedimenticolia bacterium]
MKSLQISVCLAAMALLAACGGADQAQVASDLPGTAQSAPVAQKPQIHMVRVPSGTELTLALDSKLSSETSQVGDTFSATVLEPIVIENREVIPAGSTIEGKITQAEPAKRGAGKATLAMSFGTLRLPTGYQTSIVGSFQEVSESKKKRNAAVIGGSAAGGALLGRILGKDTRGTVIGAIVGGGIGTAVLMGTDIQQAVIPADTPFGIRLEQPINIPHTGARA